MDKMNTRLKADKINRKDIINLTFIEAEVTEIILVITEVTTEAVEITDKGL